MTKLISWNVNGIRAGLKKDFWEKVLEYKWDVVAVQELKADETVMKSGIIDNEKYGYALNFFSATKKGYSGVGIFSKAKSQETDKLFSEGAVDNQSNLEILESNEGLNSEEFDFEGRIVSVKYRLKKQKLDFWLINGYYPQGGRGPERVEYKIRFYKLVLEKAKKLQEKGENVILCGDFNTTVSDIDLARPVPNRKKTGCLPNEREALEDLFKAGFIDSFRHFYPDRVDIYSYWDQITRARERNVGWRIDYFLVDKKLLPYIKKVEILDTIMGSDHCPVVLEFKE